MDYGNWKQYFQKDVWNSKVFSWWYSSFLNCEYLGPVCSIRLPQKEKSKLCFTLRRGILLVFLVLYVLTEVGIILNRYFGHLYLKILKKQHSFLYHLLFLRVSKPSSLYSFSVDLPLIAPVIADATLYWIESSFWWNKALYVW